MANIEEAFTAYLLAHAGLAALIGSRIYPQERPQEITTLPAMTYMVVSDVPIHTLTGQAKQARPMYQFTVYASTRASAQAVAVQIKAALVDYHGTLSGVVIQKIQLENELYGINETADGTKKEHTADLEFEITYVRE